MIKILIPAQTNILFFLILTTILFSSQRVIGQDYMFIGTYAVKDAKKGYWCLDRNKIEKVPVSNEMEYNKAKDDFFMKKPEWSSTYLLSPKSAAVIAEISVKDWSFNCTFKSITIEYGATLEIATENLQNRIKKNEATRDAEPEIVFTWNPKNTSTQDFNENIGGVQVHIISKPTTTSKKVLQATFTNKNTTKTAVVALVTTKGEILHYPTQIKPGGVQKIVITNEGNFDIFVEFPNTATEQPESVIDRVKQWVNEQINSNSQLEGESKGKNFSPACMCIRG
ncbi:hypothetical protein [Flavobacterium orientale]|nr:hypothetical protein [Flavobacterium orientale]